MPRVMYKNKEGKRLPGVTTITGVEEKPALKFWANKIGLQGIEVKNYVDGLARIGTLAHYLAECHIRGTVPDLLDYTPNEIDKAENAVIKFYDWLGQNQFKLLGCEMSLISEKYQFGGTCDIYGVLNGRNTLVDIKTSKGIFDEMGTQVSAYEYLLQENGHPVEDVMILRIGRDEAEGFETKQIVKRDLHMEKFLALKKVYDLNKQIKKK